MAATKIWIFFRNRYITFGRINVEAFVCIYTDFRTMADPMVLLNFVLCR